MRVGTGSDRLEQRVDERRDRARLREHDQQSEQDEHDHDRHQPVLLLLTEKREELRQDTSLAHNSPQYIREKWCRSRYRAGYGDQPAAPRPRPIGSFPVSRHTSPSGRNTRKNITLSST